MSPGKENILSPNVIKPFVDVTEWEVDTSFVSKCEVDPSFASKCQAANSHMLRQNGPSRLSNLTIVGEICRPLYPMRSVFPKIHRVYASALTVECSTSVGEASFSTLLRVLTLFRRSMTHTRKQSLVLLVFLKPYTMNIDFNVKLRKFARKGRKIQLF